jgi:dTDP-4-dehydrorhamnose reductase|tara:strand:- start:254 stop:1108 length:855 start_codon:yes stop_codon:yes gene_type:complete
MQKQKHSILILGASGYTGNAIYRELCSYFETYGTYYSAHELYDNNKAFFGYDVANDDITQILKQIKPTIIISALRGNFKAQYHAHKQVCKYINGASQCRLLFLSSVNVFDGSTDLPSYEDTRPRAVSEYGRFKASVEKLLFEKIKHQVSILRLPMVLGAYSPRILQLRQAIKHQAVFDVYPNLIVSVTTANTIAQQIHYIINKELRGVFHLASNDLVHHQDLFTEICEKISNKTPIFKSIYNSNDDQYLAVLPKFNTLPANYQTTVASVIENSTLEDLITLKNT